MLLLQFSRPCALTQVCLHETFSQISPVLPYMCKDTQEQKSFAKSVFEKQIFFSWFCFVVGFFFLH